MFKYVVLFGLVAIAGVSYWVIYHRRFVRHSSKNHGRSDWISPQRLSVLLLIVSLATGFALSVFDVYQCEQDRSSDEETIVVNRYLVESAMDSNIEYVFTQYQLVFGGSYFDHDRITICITDDAPQDLVDYLVDNSIPFEYVERSYSELLSLMQMIIRDSTNIEGMVGVGIDEKMNSVVIHTNDPDRIPDSYQNYLADGVIQVVESEDLVER